MKKKKNTALLCVALSSLLVTQSSAMASTQIKGITSKSGLISVTVTTDSYVTDSDDTESKLSKAITFEVYSEGVENLTKSDIKGFGELYPDAQTFTFSFGLKSADKYKIVVSDKDGKTEKSFVYSDTTGRQRFVNKINECLVTPKEKPENLTPENIAKAADEIHDIIVSEDNYSDAVSVGINVDEYKDYLPALQKAIITKLVKIAPNSSMTEDVFADVYKESEAVCRINEGGDSLAKETVMRLNPEFEDVKFDKITNTDKKEWIKSTVVLNKPYDTLEEILSFYNESCALYSINNAKVLDIEDEVKGYAKLLEIEDEKEYKAYEDSANSTVNSNLVDILAEKAAQNTKELLKALDSAVADEDDDEEEVFGSQNNKVSGGKGGFSVAGPQEQIQIGQESGVAQSSGSFADVPQSHWAYTAITKMQQDGVISGDGTGNFYPAQTVKREEFVKMIIAAFNLEDETASSHFHDVFDSDWFYPYVSAAFEKGIVIGDTLGLFGVNAAITREDATLIASRVLKLTGKMGEAQREYASFGDDGLIADYAKEAVKELYSMGIINGTDKGDFEPKRFCTRAEAAVIIYNISR